MHVASQKPVKKVVKKVVKKPVKKPTKATAVGSRTLSEEVSLLAGFGLGGLKGYGGGNGEILFSPTFIATAGAWVFILLKFVLRVF